MQRRICIVLLVVLVVLFTATFRQLAGIARAASASTGDWPSYVFSDARTGYNAAETQITSKTAPNLKLHWSYKDPAAGIISVEPVEANGLVYWGSWTDGIEHATNLNGTQVWGTSLGVSPPYNCNTHTLGIASTATIATEKIGGSSKSVLYVGGGDVNFYALDAMTGAQLWKTQLGTIPDAFIWSSPAVYNGSVYIGLSSRGDCPLVQGKLYQLDAATGSVQHVFNTVPNNCNGASVWGSPAIDEQAGTVYFVTGNIGNCVPEPYSVAMIELRASDLSFLGSWQVPQGQQTFDGDFGNTPTLFQGTINGTRTNLVGAANKNGIFYAFKRDAISNGPVWTATIATSGDCPQCGNGSISPAAYDGTYLYVAGGNSTINGKSCQGGLRALNPATGAFIWQHCMPDGPVLGAVAMVHGVVFVGEGSHEMAIAAHTGKKLFDYDTGAMIYAAASISHGVVYFGSTNGLLYALGL